MSNLKLGVEVVSAHNLMPTDGEGSASSSVELYFDGQKFRTTVKEKDLNPVWNESFYFNIKDPTNLQNLTLDAFVYNNNKATHSKAIRGRVRLTGTSFVPYSDAVVSHYPLEKRGIFSRVKGELGLKVYVTDIPSVKPSNPVPDVESFADFVSSFFSGKFPHADLRMSQPQVLEAPNPVSNPLSNEKAESRHTFHHLPKENHHQQHSLTTTATQQSVKSSADVMKAEPQQPKNVSMYSAAPSQSIDYLLKETSPILGGGQIVGGRVIRGAEKPGSTYDLVEQMQFLFVRIVKARDLPTREISGSLDPYVEVRLGNYKGVTKHFEKNKNPEWNEVFAFARERMQSSVLEVVTKDKDLVKDNFVGIIRYDLNEVPTQVPPGSPVAPQWYKLEDKKGNKTKGELMFAVWMGTQTDEAFLDAWHSDGATPVGMSASAITSIRSKVYHAPRLWYVRVNVIEAQDLVPTEKNRFPEVCVTAQIGNQVLKTKPVQARAMNPFWNEDLLFVTAEPFEDRLFLSVEDRVGSSCKDEIIGRVIIPLNTVDKSADGRPIRSRWYKLEKPVAVDVDQLEEEKFSSRLHLQVCLEGGYHVLDESTHYSSDLRPTEKQLWKPSIGVLELGILNAAGLPPMKTRNDMSTSDTYCVARYGHKWVRTRTIISSLNPKYNEQYSWEVYDPATVLTVAVFDNGQLLEKSTIGDRDMTIGKVRIRISTLETGRVYTHSYPLLVLHPSGVRKMGELHLAIRFSRKSLVNMLYMYTLPLLPKMHYIRPLSVMQLDYLRHHAVGIVAATLSRTEPPLRKEVIEYMSHVDSHLWSLRRSKVNFFRLMAGISGLLAVGKWFGEDVCMWKNPMTTVLVHVVFVMLVCFPGLMLAAVFLYMFLKGIWNYRNRPGYPPHISTKLSYVESVHLDELDEEFDTFPTSSSSEVVRMRYDRLRSIAGRIQAVVGDVATQMERIQLLLSWRDPLATAIFVMFCLIAALVLYVTPFRVLVVIAGFYLMRHPWICLRFSEMSVNFFRRLPDRRDSLL